MPQASIAGHGVAVVFAVAILGMSFAAQGEGIGAATVVYATTERLYLDAGTADGIRPGALFWLERNGRRVARVAIIDASDHDATALVKEATASPRIGDQMPFTRAAPTNATAPKPGSSIDRSAKADFTDDALAAAWSASLVNTPPPLVRYRNGGGSATSRLAVTGNAGTEYRFYSHFQSQRYLRNEQRFDFRIAGEHLGTEGLALRIGGMVLARYDNRADAYLNGHRAYPLIRDVALTYQPQRSRFFGSLGRFTPRAPIVHTIDGAEVGVEMTRLSLVFFGGLKPRELDLVPTPYQQAMGGAVRLRPFTGRWRYEIDGAVLGELRRGRFSRAAIGLDNRLSNADKFRFSETAVLDFIGVSTAGDPKADVALSLIGVDANLRLVDTVRMDFSARYDERTFFAKEDPTIDAAWLAAMRGDRHGQVELGVPFQTRKRNELRAFLFSRGDFDGAGVDKGHSGGGVTYRDPTIFSTRTGLTTTVDYGFGSGHLANIDVALTTPFYHDRLRLLSGLFTTWSWTSGTDVQTLRHLLYLFLNGHVVDHLDLFGSLSATYDHALVRLTYPFGGWLRFDLGATYSF